MRLSYCKLQKEKKTEMYLWNAMPLVGSQGHASYSITGSRSLDGEHWCHLDGLHQRNTHMYTVSCTDRKLKTKLKFGDRRTDSGKDLKQWVLGIQTIRVMKNIIKTNVPTSFVRLQRSSIRFRNKNLIRYIVRNKQTLDTVCKWKHTWLSTFLTL